MSAGNNNSDVREEFVKIVHTVLCKSNANEIRGNSSFVLATFL